MMVDPRRLRQLLDRIADEERHLDRLRQIDRDELLADHDRMHAVKYGFVVAIEAAIDAGRHVIASEGMTPPDSFAQVFTRLGESGALTVETARAMEHAARFRNLLVHQYAEIDDARVVEFLSDRLEDFARFRRELAGGLDV
jgi:uncharacterized protein YutE (UPF0331/DUF86 family)